MIGLDCPDCPQTTNIAQECPRFSDDLGKVSDGLSKVSDGLGRVSDGLGSELKITLSY